MENITTWIGVAASAVSGIVTVVTVLARNKTRRDVAAITAGTPRPRAPSPMQ